MTELDPILTTEGGALVDAITRSVEPYAMMPGQRFLVVSTDGTVSEHDTFDLDPEPARKRGLVNLVDCDSFILYVNQHQQGDATIITADTEVPVVWAVMNWHGTNAAGWGDHRAKLAFRPIPEWEAWKALNGTLMSQVDFAQHLEDCQSELVEPPAADMIALAKTFEATKNVEFKEANVLESGARQFAYQETVAARAGQQGALEVPSEFTIGVAPFVGTEPYRVTCRLRYRIESGGLRIGYQMHRPHLVVEDAVKDVVSRIETDTGMSVLFGAAPA